MKLAIQKKWALGYLVAFMIMIFLNYWSTTNVGIVADDNQAIIQPAGFAFSIWGIIYILVFIWIIKLFFTREWENSAAQRLGYWPIVNFLLNGTWILVFTQELLFLSTIVIFSLLVTLIIIHDRISKGRYHWYDRFPFSIYFGWVTVASVVNVFAWAVGSNIESILGMDELTWTIIMLAAATLIGIFVSIVFKDWLYPLVLIWPFYGIYIENSNAYMILDGTLIIISILLVITSLSVIVKKVRS